MGKYLLTFHKKLNIFHKHNSLLWLQHLYIHTNHTVTINQFQVTTQQGVCKCTTLYQYGYHNKAQQKNKPTDIDKKFHIITGCKCVVLFLELLLQLDYTKVRHATQHAVDTMAQQLHQYGLSYVMKQKMKKIN